MTQQFKFGDRVKYRATDFLFIYDKGDGRAHVVSETGVSGAVLISDLTLISHPDTVRLDWLEKNRAILYHNIAEDIKHGCAPIEVGCWHGEKPHGGCTVREAIDTAMREKAA